MRRQTLFRRGVLPVLALAAAFSGSAGRGYAALVEPDVRDCATATSQTGPTVIPRAPTGTCPRLDSRLLQLSQAEDPPTFAAGAGLDYRDGTVLVVVELVDPIQVPQGYGLIVEATYANLIQARAPLEQLCSLSADVAVLFVRPPAAISPES